MPNSETRTETVKTLQWDKIRPTKRRLIQLYAALLYNAHLRGFVDGEIFQGKSKALCVPGFNCYSCPGAIGACPLGSLQNALAASGRHAGFYMYGILLLFGLTLGRTICGWICPLGLIQELLYKVPTYKLKKNRITHALTYLKYVLLAVFVIAIPLWHGLREGMAVPGFCKYICPAGTLEGAVGLLSNPKNADYFAMLGPLFTRKFVIMLIIGTACVFIYRSFCRFLCPLGAIYGMFCRIALTGVRVNEDLCTHCGACVRTCQMDVHHVGDHECIHCGKCMNKCPQKAISLKAGQITLMAPEVPAKAAAAGAAAPAAAGSSPDQTKKRSVILWSAALAVLACALIWFNFLDPSLKSQAMEPAAVAESTESAAVSSEDTEEAAESTAEIGYEIGNQLADFSLECLDGSTFRLADTRGKVVFLNLWATYCGPCVKELPHFDEFDKTHDDVVVLAVHSQFVTDDVPQFLEGRDLGLTFAIDTPDNLVWNITGGNSTLPQTIVLNRRGEVIYNQRGSVTPELLESLYQQASE
ncbi:MAG: 4Fe-4S binding protein [Lachnospiraceae bacterium]|nr:4Fe-4S binding protein [Lachnospiraceae bacterium]